MLEAVVAHETGRRKRQITPDAHYVGALPLPDLCDTIRNLQVRRRFCIRQQTRLNNSLGALARWQLGWSLAKPEAEREKIRKQAAGLVASMRKDGEITDQGALLLPYLQDIDGALEPFNVRRKAIEKDMIRYAAATPGAAFIESVRGVGLLGLAVVIGEAGNLSDYPNPAKLWKRLGWAPPDTYPTGEKSEGRKIPRRVKGELYGVIVEPCMKNNDGAYKALYDARKAAYMEAGKTKLHAHKLALRVMLKAILRDLWCAWRDETAK